MPSVFDKESKVHEDFRPLLRWIDSIHGRLVIGGSKYNQELRKMGRYLAIYSNYDKQGKLIRLDDGAVDSFAVSVKKKEPSSQFNDEHLVAMVAVSGCKVVCTNDAEAMPFIRKRSLYAGSSHRPPKIYNKKTHKHLCSKNHIAACCRIGG